MSGFFYQTAFVGLWLANVLFQPQVLAQSAKPDFVQQARQAYLAQLPAHNEEKGFSDQWAWGTGKTATKSLVWYAWSDYEGFIFFALDTALDTSDQRQLFGRPDSRFVYWTTMTGSGLYASNNQRTVIRATNEWIDLCYYNRQMSYHQYLEDCLEFLVERTSIDLLTVSEYLDGRRPKLPKYFRP